MHRVDQKRSFVLPKSISFRSWNNILKSPFFGTKLNTELPLPSSCFPSSKHTTVPDPRLNQRSCINMSIVSFNHILFVTTAIPSLNIRQQLTQHDANVIIYNSNNLTFMLIVCVAIIHCDCGLVVCNANKLGEGVVTEEPRNILLLLRVVVVVP